MQHETAMILELRNIANGNMSREIPRIQNVYSEQRFYVETASFTVLKSFEISIIRRGEAVLDDYFNMSEIHCCHRA